ncbi:site-2 protease family protein [Chloroflexota bacterium]
MLGLDPATLFARIIVLLVAFTIHEFAHAWAATQLGDNTPSMYGRLTLNPLAHLDPMGSLLLIVAGFGWAKPVPVNPYILQRRSPAALMLVSLAGPFSNFLLAILAAIPFRVGWLSLIDVYTQGAFFPNAAQICYAFVFINLVLMLFNLIPVAPLDGDKIAEYFLPPSMARHLETIRPYGPVILIVIVFVLPRIGVDIIGGPLGALLELLLIG